MASTWGTNTWGSNEWQDNVIKPDISGQLATTQLGDLSSFNETGWGRLTWNTADWGEGADETVSVTGLEVTASPGSITPAFTYLLEMIGANHSMTTSVGTVAVDAERGVPVTGVEATFATPTLSYTGTLVGWGRDGWSDLSWGESPDQVIPLVGREATASVGSLTPADVIGLSGQESTTNVGSTTIKLDSTQAIAGQEATASPGTLGLEFGPADITGVSSTASVGSVEVGPATLVDLTGVTATSAVGSLTPADVIGLTGVAATSSTGSIIPADVVGLSLDAINALQGEGGVEAFENISTGSNSSFSGVATGSNTSYSNTSTGSNSSYSDQSTGSNSSYSDVASGSNTSYSDAA